MFQRKQFLLFLGAYAALRIFSYFFGPETPLQPQHFLNSLVSAAIVLLVIYWLLKRDIRGWYCVALEVLLGGSGGFFSLFHLSLRTWLLAVSVAIFTFQKIRTKTLCQEFNRVLPITSIIGGLLLVALLQALHGYVVGHNIRLVFADTLPYFFLLYYFPLKELILDIHFKTVALNALTATVIGNTFFILLTFAGFSSGIFALQDTYYHWYRDVAEGKITELPFHFYRLVLNEHLLLAPVFLYFFYGWLNKKSTFFSFFSALLLIILSLNLTRIYLVALAVGILALFNRTGWRRSFMGSVSALIFFVAIFTSIHLAASRGASLGWEIFGVRLQSIVSPAIEESSLSRLLLLPKILEKIKAHPILGTGLGDMVSVYSPIFKEVITTPHFDWGYLEILSELGIIGLLLWIALVIFFFHAYTKNQLPRWQLASFLALLAINLTSPALFHVFGIVFFTFLLTSFSNRSGDASGQ